MCIASEQWYAVHVGFVRIYYVGSSSAGGCFDRLTEIPHAWERTDKGFPRRENEASALAVTGFYVPNSIGVRCAHPHRTLKIGK